jgi:hypothetical protein
LGAVLTGGSATVWAWLQGQPIVLWPYYIGAAACIGLLLAAAGMFLRNEISKARQSRQSGGTTHEPDLVAAIAEARARVHKRSPDAPTLSFDPSTRAFQMYGQYLHYINVANDSPIPIKDCQLWASVRFPDGSEHRRENREQVSAPFDLPRGAAKALPFMYVGQSGTAPAELFLMANERGTWKQRFPSFHLDPSSYTITVSAISANAAPAEIVLKLSHVDGKWELTEASKASQSDTRIERDAWLLDAIWRVHLGTWDRQQSDVALACSDQKTHDEFVAAAKLIKQAAFDGTLPTWGKLGPVGSVWKPIPPMDWENEEFGLHFGPEYSAEQVHLARYASAGAFTAGPEGRGNWGALKTSRAAVERLWP